VTRLLRIALLLAALAFPAHALAGPGLIVGLDDDSLKWHSRPSSYVATYRHLGVRAVRVTLGWQPGQWTPTRSDRTSLNRVASAAWSVRIVLAVTGSASAPPLDAAARDTYCGYVSNVLSRYPQIHDIVVWTEPNSSQFWRPQDGAAAAYEALLARCWDVLHALHPGVSVIAASAPHHDPVGWYEGLARAYKASARTARLYDVVGHNAYPETSAELPSKQHKHSKLIDQGDYARLVSVLRSAFKGTGQPLVPIWYMEDGFQTAPTRTLYSGTETDRAPVSPEQQATQLAAALRLAYCQPLVGAFFNFELVDERDLAGWQSGLLWPDLTRKPAYDAFKQTISDVARGAIRCAK
jgi:hypothetical protein